MRGARSLVFRGAGMSVVGVAVGLLWAAVAPVVRGASEGVESQISGEVAFAGLAVLAGVAAAAFALVRPGPRPATGVIVVLVGSGAGSLIAWGVGRAVGAPVLVATGVLVLWPLTACLVTAVACLVMVLLHPAPQP